MRDTYPQLETLPAEHLVAPGDQPEYVDPPALHVPDGANVGDALLAAPPDALALVGHESGASYTFGELDETTARLANALRALGVRPGERLAFRSPNRPEAVIAAIAAWRAGAIVVPTPPQARAAELRFLLQDTGATTVIASGDDSSFDDVVDALRDTEVTRCIAFGAEQPGWHQWQALIEGASAEPAGAPLPASLPALIWHTGGTTGVPKACYHTHRRYLLGGLTFAQATGVTAGERWAAAAPIGHALGFLCHTTYTLLHGATAVMIERFADPAAVLEAIAAHDIDTFVAISATWSRLLDTLDERPELDAIPSLRRGFAMWQSASSAGVYDGWRDRGIELLNNFGSTAFANWVVVPQAPGPIPRASLGRPTPGYEVRAIEPDSHDLTPLPAGAIGRMAVRGPTGLTYWNRHEQQARDVVDGWTLQDDLIQFDDDGFVDYLGRTDFVISSAGHKIAPVEVEQVISGHPDVSEVGVVGSPDPLRREVVAAFVVVTDPARADQTLRKSLQDLVKAELAPHKYPRRVEFVRALPRDPVGKLQPRVLQQWAVEGVPEQARFT